MVHAPALTPACGTWLLLLLMLLLLSAASCASSHLPTEVLCRRAAALVYRLCTHAADAWITKAPSRASWWKFVHCWKSGVSTHHSGRSMYQSHHRAHQPSPQPQAQLAAQLAPQHGCPTGVCSRGWCAVCSIPCVLNSMSMPFYLSRHGHVVTFWCCMSCHVACWCNSPAWISLMHPMHGALTCMQPAHRALVDHMQATCKSSIPYLWGINQLLYLSYPLAS